MTTAALVLVFETAVTVVALRWAKREVRRMLRRTPRIDPVLDANPYLHVDALPDDPIVSPVFLRGELVGTVSIDRRTAVPTNVILDAPPTGD